MSGQFGNTGAPASVSCRYCGGPAYPAEGAEPAHTCCRDWRDVIAAGYPCPSCQAARFLADPANRRRAMPSLPRALADGRPFTPDRRPMPSQPCSWYGSAGTCGATPARPYLPGWRCPAHTPAVLAGQPEPDVAPPAARDAPDRGQLTPSPAAVPEASPTRVVHCRREPYDVYIGRGSPYGNPFKIGPDGDREEVVARFEQYLPTRPDLLALAPSLRGKILGCFCAPKACHGHVWARYADDEAA